MSELPNDGDVIEFETVPEGSLVKAGVRYRVEKKPLDTEFLLVDVASGHAGRVPAVEFRKAKWGLPLPGPVGEHEGGGDQVEAEKPAADPIAKPLPPEPTPPSSGILSLDPLPQTPSNPQ